VLLIRTFVAAGGALPCILDEPLARRWGRGLTTRGPSRDPLASSTPRSGATSGVRWIVLTWGLTPPWTPRAGALPVVRVPAPTPAVRQRRGRRQQTGHPWARHVMRWVRCGLPGGAMPSIGDPTDRVHARGGACARWGVRVGAPLRREAGVEASAPARSSGPTGRPRVHGGRVPPLAQVRTDAQPPWQRVRVRWDHGRRCALDVSSGTAVWARRGQPVRPIRWGRVRAPQGRLQPRASGATGPPERPRALRQPFGTRGTLETPVEASRAHLGLKTQRQGSDRAMARTTPWLCALDSTVARLAHARYPDGKVPIRAAAWYATGHATCAAGLAAVRPQGWGDFRDSPAAHAPDLGEIPRAERARVAHAVCDSH
jgi:hypothetical protein